MIGEASLTQIMDWFKGWIPGKDSGSAPLLNIDSKEVSVSDQRPAVTRVSTDATLPASTPLPAPNHCTTLKSEIIAIAYVDGIIASVRFLINCLCIALPSVFVRSEKDGYYGLWISISFIPILIYICSAMLLYFGATRLTQWRCIAFLLIRVFVTILDSAYNSYVYYKLDIVLHYFVEWIHLGYSICAMILVNFFLKVLAMNNVRKSVDVQDESEEQDSPRISVESIQ